MARTSSASCKVQSRRVPVDSLVAPVMQRLQQMSGVASSLSELMFTFLRRFRRQTAVLTALALVASVLVAVPASAADDDPKADYTATFSACVGAATENQEFADVPELHGNRGDINCIGYYGITQGTGDGTTYSPKMSVTRAHMALFLTRLAKVVGIPMVADPADPGFTDIGDLPAKWQTAIAQLKQLNITKGNNPSGTTYGPSHQVTRGQMALFIARLMNEMDPMAENDDTVFGYTPDDVGVVNVIDTTDDDVDNPDEPGKAKSPFGDLKTVTKETYDAITNLWELGVASGASGHATSYAPDVFITRAAMAGFMAGVLDHSNARPAGVTMQATDTEGIGDYTSTIVASYRSDRFAPVVDVSLKTFDTTQEGVLPFDDDGKCKTKATCQWTDSETLTDDNGNVFLADQSVAPDADNDADDVTWYAWMGDDQNDEFSSEVSYSSVTAKAASQALGIKITVDTPRDARTVNMDKDQTVVLTLQLIDEATASDNSKAVAKPGVEISITTYTEGGTDVFPLPDVAKTDANGQTTFTLKGPEGTDENEDDRTDIVVFAGDTDSDSDTPNATSGNVAIVWSDDDVATAKTADPSAPKYAVIDDGEVSIRGAVTFYDKYGNPAGRSGEVTITIGGGSGKNDTKKIDSRGSASFRATLDADQGDTVSVAFTDGPADATITNPPDVVAVVHANRSDAGRSGTVAVYEDDNAFRFDVSNAEINAAQSGVLYSYNPDDTFISGGKYIDLDKFETEIQKTDAEVQVVSYTEGSSIFVVR